MSLLISALIILLVAVVAVWLLQSVSTDANLTRIGTVVIILIALVAIVQRAGYI